MPRPAPRALGALVSVVLLSGLGALPAQAAPVDTGRPVSLSGSGVVTALTATRTKRRVPARKRALRVARAQKGDPYRWGAEGPHRFDCSGLTYFSYDRVGRDLPRTSSQQRAATKRIRPGRARRGDLVFFHNRSGVYHVGLYAGRGRIWHAPEPGTRVHRTRIWSSKVSYGRVRR